MSENLGRFPVLSHFSETHLGQLRGCAQQRAYPPGTKIVLEGQSSSELYLLLSGNARAQRATPFGPFDFAVLCGGQLFGEQSFLDGRERTTTVEVASAVEAMVFEADGLRAVAAMDTTFKQALFWTFWKSLSEKLRGANARLLDFFEPDGAPASTGGGSTPAEGGRSRLDLASKKKVFEGQPLSEMEINFLASLSTEEHYGPGQILFRQGDEGDRMFVVVDGEVMISTTVPNAGEEALSFIERGDYFGEMALIDRRPRSADARAHPDKGAVVLAIGKDVLEGILSVERVSSLRLLELLCRMASHRLRQTNEKLLGWYLVAGADPALRPRLNRA